VTFVASTGGEWDGTVISLLEHAVSLHTLRDAEDLRRLHHGAVATALTERPCAHAHLHADVYRCVIAGHGRPECADCFSHHWHADHELVCSECGANAPLFVPIVRREPIHALGRITTLILLGAVLCMPCARRLLP
jgi:hypothetical protein